MNSNIVTYYYSTNLNKTLANFYIFTSGMIVLKHRNDDIDKLFLCPHRLATSGISSKSCVQKRTSGWQQHVSPGSDEGQPRPKRYPNKVVEMELRFLLLRLCLVVSLHCITTSPAVMNIVTCCCCF